MEEVNPVEAFIKGLKEGAKARFFLRGNFFYAELGERTLESALKEKDRHPKVRRLLLVARGGEGLGGITI